VRLVRGFAYGALDLLVPLMADEHDLVPARFEPASLRVHLCHQRTGGIDDIQPALSRACAHRRRNPVRGEEHGLALRDVFDLVDEHGAFALEFRDDVRVVGRSACARRPAALRSRSARSTT
jgi:hypothetical protein